MAPRIGEIPPIRGKEGRSPGVPVSNHLASSVTIKDHASIFSHSPPNLYLEPLVPSQKITLVIG